MAERNEWVGQEHFRHYAAPSGFRLYTHRERQSWSTLLQNREGSTVKVWIITLFGSFMHLTLSSSTPNA